MAKSVLTSLDPSKFQRTRINLIIQQDVEMTTCRNEQHTSGRVFSRNPVCFNTVIHAASEGHQRTLCVKKLAPVPRSSVVPLAAHGTGVNKPRKGSDRESLHSVRL